MITLAFGQMVYFFFVALKAYGGDDGLPLDQANQLFGLNLRDDFVFYYVCLAVLLAYLYGAGRLVNSRFGMVVRGIRESERRMAHLGFSTYRYKLVCYTIAGATAGLAGALLANHERFVSPDMMHWTKSSELLIMVVLGGMGTRFGAVLGAAALIILESVLSAATDNWMFYLGPILVAVILFTQRGIFSALVGQEK
jgi:branched-chain amino acid transport system permease protein